MKNSDIILYSLLVESGALSKTDFQNLQEETKVDAIRVVASSLLKDITGSLNNIDTTLIDKSRGDIKSLRELEDIQTNLKQLETLYERAGGYPNQLVKNYHAAIIKSIMILNKYSKEYKTAYRLKHTLLIIQYQQVVLAVASALAYLFSSVVDFQAGAVLRTNIRVEETAAYKTLVNYMNSEENGSLKVAFADVNKTENFYHEVDETTISTILEANDIISVVIDGLTNMYRNLDNGGKLTNLLYKAAGAVVILMAAKEFFYMIERSRFSVQNIFDGIRNFANMNQLPSLNKLIQFSTKFKADSEANSELASREAEDTKKNIVTELKSLPQETLDVAPSATKVTAPVSGSDDFFF